MADLFACGAMLFALLIYVIIKSRRKKKDLYLFSLPGWKINQDDQNLYEMKTLFQGGLVAKALGQDGFGINHWHSNLKKEASPYYTGFIQLEKIALVPTIDLRDTSYGIATLATHSYRYFWAKLEKTVPHLIFLQSKDLAQLSTTPHAHLASVLQGLEQLVGLQGWTVMTYGKDLVVLVPELFQQHEVQKFLEHSEALAQKF